MQEKLSDYPQAMKLFHDFTPEQLARFTVIHLAPKEALIEEGSFEDNLYLVLSGICEANRLSHPDDSLFAKYQIKPMEFIGLSEILSPDPVRRGATIIAKTPVAALKISGADFLCWPTTSLKTYNQIIHDILNKHFTVQSQLINSVFLSSYEAVVSCLSDLYERYLFACYKEGYQGKVKIWDTRKEIGLYIGRDTRSVDRAFSRLCKEELISISKGKVYIDKAQSVQLRALL